MSKEPHEQTDRHINITDISDLETTLHELADRSGEVILPFFRSKLEVQEKHGKGMYDPVTQADRGAEQVMREIVATHFPDHGIIGEEFPNKDPDAELCWIFDPIDGTRSFIIGAPIWGTLIALSQSGQPKLGMMNQPFTRERYWGGPKGAFYRSADGETIKLATSSVTDLENATLSTTGPDFFSSRDNWRKFKTLSQKTRMTRYGFDCYSYCLLSLGLLDIVAETDLEVYDIAPLVPIVRAAGGVITSWDNGDPAKGGSILACATPELHKKALEVLS